MHLNSLIPLINAKGIEKNPQVFHEQINIVFHNHEAKKYDEIHQEMWESLPLQYNLLINDLNTSFQDLKDLKLLDIGCGTGLSAELLLSTPLGTSIKEITLLDTSSEMLSKACKRVRRWGKKTEIVEGDIRRLDGKFDVVLISSVLHHIPDYMAFLKQVSDLHNENGILIIIHDPLKESLMSKIYQSRCEEYTNYLKYHPTKKSIITRGLSKLKRVFRKKDYIADVNKELLSKGIISEALSEVELWSVTDIHVEGLPYSSNIGVSKSRITESLIDYQLLSFRTYAFYGSLQSNLKGKFKQLELELIRAKDDQGRNLSSIWRKIGN